MSFQLIAMTPPMLVKKVSKKDIHTIQQMTFSIKDFFSKCDQIRSFLPIWLHLLKKSLIENFIFCAVSLRSKIIYYNLMVFLYSFPAILSSLNKSTSGQLFC